MMVVQIRPKIAQEFVNGLKDDMSTYLKNITSLKNVLDRAESRDSFWEEDVPCWAGGKAVKNMKKLTKRYNEAVDIYNSIVDIIGDYEVAIKLASKDKNSSGK